MALQSSSSGRRVLVLVTMAGLLVLLTIKLSPVPVSLNLKVKSQKIKSNRTFRRLAPSPLSSSSTLTLTAVPGLFFRPLGCACERNYSPVAAAAAAGSSSCGDVAERRGVDQRVISFSVYGSMSSPYFKGIALNAELASKFYPGWVVRVYHHYNLDEPELRAQICNLTCSYDVLDFCDANHLLPKLGDISGQPGQLWRFAVLSDPTVSRFLIRDVDSLLNQRELDAVDAWLASNLTFHVMRDHPWHGTEILGGMWGGWNRHNAIYRPIRQQLLRYSRTRVKSSDQRALAELLWPELVRRQDVLAHDSYLCQKYPLSSPWPTQRRHGQFVGSRLLRKNETVTKKCPKKCRPPQHQDWQYC